MIAGEPGTGDHTEFLSDWRELCAIGATERGGVDREAATRADRQTKTWLSEWFERRGLSTRVDKVGNQFGLFEWSPGAPYVLLGSHLDSQPTAGRFDGAYGVLAGAYAASRVARRVRADGARPRFNVGVVNWFNEEGSRFQPSMMGSGVFTGRLDLGETLDITDIHGVTVAAALDEIGFRGNSELTDVAAYGEIHVEQGPILDQEEIAIGVVESTWAARKYEITVRGEQSHTGSTIMRQRRDALLGAARIVVLIRELADDAPDDRMHSSVGHLTVVPNSPVVVAKEAHLYADLRSAEPALLDHADQRLRAECARIERETGVEIELVLSHKWDVESYTSAGVLLAEALADELGLSHRRLATIAGHDSTNMKDEVPTVMLFVPSVDAIAHNELEFTEDKHLLMGLDMLTEIAYALVHGTLTT